MSEFDQLRIHPDEVTVDAWNEFQNVFNEFKTKLGNQLSDTNLKLGGTQIHHTNGKLHIEGPIKKIGISTTSQDANGDALTIGILKVGSFRLGLHKDYAWIQSHNRRPLAINPIGNNVGIGTAQPKFPVHIKGQSMLLERKANDNAKTGLHFYVDNKHAVITNRNNFIKNGTTHNKNLYLTTPENLYFQTGNGNKTFGYNRLTITKEGRIGINIATPQNTFHIKGDNGLCILEGKTTAYLQFFPKTLEGKRKGYLGFNKRDNDTLTIANESATGQIIIAGKKNLHLSISGQQKITVPSTKNANLAEAPFYFKKFKFSQTADGVVALKATGYDSTNWTAAIVGFSTGTVDINEKHTGPFMELQMLVPKGKKDWHIYANLRTHSNSRADWTIQVMFIRNQFCQLEKDYNAPPSIPNYNQYNFPGRGIKNVNLDLQ